MDDLKLYGKSSHELELLLNTVRIFSTDISMEFSLEKCAALTIHKRKATHTEGLTLSNNNTIKGLRLEKSYKYQDQVHSGHSRLDSSRAGGPKSQNQEAHDCPSYFTATE